MRVNKFLASFGLAACIMFGLAYLGGQVALRYALEHKANTLGMDWAHYIETRFVEKGITPDGSTSKHFHAPTLQQMEETLASVFAVGHIFQVDYLGLDCACHVSLDALSLAQSGHLATNLIQHDQTSDPHQQNVHSHSSDDTRADGAHSVNGRSTEPIFIHSHAPANATELQVFGAYPADLGKLTELGRKGTHTLEILTSEQPELPSTFAAVYHTIFVGGVPAYMLRVMVNLERQKKQFSFLIFGGMTLSALFFALTVGYPVWRLLHSTDEKRAADERASYLATHDVLTKLHNRNSFQDCFPKIVEKSVRAKKSGLLFLLDLNGFKEVNDYYGHDVGDDLLVEFAKFLSLHSPEDAYIARLGGDEFVVVLSNLPEQIDDPQAQLEMPGKLSMAIGSGAEQVTVGIAGGVVRFPQDSKTSTDLVRMADLALYSAKADRSAAIKTYTPELTEAFQERLSQKEDFRKALKNREIIPYFQPIVNVLTGRIEGFEALARWRHPERGLLTPHAFGEALSDGELSARLGVAMLMQVVDHMADWQARGIPFKRVAMNASTGDLKRPNLAQDVLDVLADRGLQPSQLTIEVTENCLFGEDKPAFLDHLTKLRNAGCNIALDDFGTGFSSITQLKELPITIVKIDKSFIDNILENRDDQSIIDALQSLSHAMRFDLILEGVETADQVDYLRACGFTYIQGYYFSKPIPEADVGPFVAAQNKRGTGSEYLENRAAS